MSVRLGNGEQASSEGLELPEALAAVLEFSEDWKVKVRL